MAESERCPTCGQYVQVETTGEGTSRFVPVAVEDGGYWEDRATAAAAEVERLREKLDAAYDALEAFALDKWGATNPILVPKYEQALQSAYYKACPAAPSAMKRSPRDAR